MSGKDIRNRKHEVHQRDSIRRGGVWDELTVLTHFSHSGLQFEGQADMVSLYYCEVGPRLQRLLNAMAGGSDGLRSTHTKKSQVALRRARIRYAVQ